MVQSTRASEVDAVIVGAGFSGLYMLHRLREEGYGTIYGWQYSVFVLGYGLSPFVVGVARDYFGNYDLALLASAGAVALAAVAAPMLKTRPEFEVRHA